jgi:hypothetical protein
MLKLGMTFVCASYKNGESTSEILSVAKANGLHPRSSVKTLVVGSVTKLCPQYQPKAAVSGQ